MKQEFPNDLIGTALASLGVNIDNRFKVLEAMPEFLADPVKCRNLIAAVQGAEGAKRSDPVYMERYRKRAERMFNQYASVAEATAPVEVAAEASAPAIQPAPTTAVAAATSGGQKMAKAKKVKAAKVPKERKPGVIDNIIMVLKDGGGTVKEIAAKVAKKFSDRDPDGILATTKIQLHRLQGEPRNLKIKSTKQEGTNELVYKI